MNRAWPDLFIRADADSLIGAGHMMRTLALAQAWRKRGRVTFLTCRLPDWLSGRIVREGCSVRKLSGSHPDRRDLFNTLDALSGVCDPWVVVDGYHLDVTYQRSLKEAGYRLLLMDDGSFLQRHNVDILVNQNLGSEHLDYRRCDETDYLLGAPYVLLRDEFLTRRAYRRAADSGPLRLLVTVGGSDPGNHSMKVLEALSRIRTLDLKTTLVVGGSNPHLASLEAVAAELKAVRLVRNIADMSRVMARSDLAITAGGSTCWELAFMGVPSLVLAVAENQRGIARALHEVGTARFLGWADEVAAVDLADAISDLTGSPAERERMASIGQSTIDGRGRERVVETMAAYNSGKR